MMKRNLLFLLTFIVSTLTVWAQDYTLNVVSNYEGGASLSFHVTQDQFNGGYHYTLNASYFVTQ